MVRNFKRSVGSLLRLRSQVCLGSLVARVTLKGRRGFEELSLFCWTVADGICPLFWVWDRLANGGCPVVAFDL